MNRQNRYHVTIDTCDDTPIYADSIEDAKAEFVARMHTARAHQGKTWEDLPMTVIISGQNGEHACNRSRAY